MCLPNRASVSCEDRKSTRLNSSHITISYAVFCLKKKKKKNNQITKNELSVNGTLFPLCSFVVNVVGCLVFGAIPGSTIHRVLISSTTLLFLLTAILAGFTTV